MGKELDSGYYTEVFTSSPKYRKKWSDIKTRAKLWKQVSGLVTGSRVIDLGCGPGQFAECLYDINPIVEEYDGYDFSEGALHMAGKVADRTGWNREQWRFHRVDLVKAARVFPEAIGPASTFYTCLETLEHVERDDLILSLIPEGAKLVISVPSFDDPGHVRHFTTLEKALERYRPYIDISTIKQPWKWFVLSGIKRSTNEQKRILEPTLFDG